MKNYNVATIKVKEEKIFIKLEKCHTLEDENYKLEAKQVSASTYFHFQNGDELSYPEFENVNMIQSDPIEFETLYNSLNPSHVLQMHRLTSFTYELPTDPDLALHFIALFDDYMMHPDCYMTEKTIKDNISEDMHFKKSCLLEFFHPMLNESEINPKSVIERKKDEYICEHQFLSEFINLAKIPVAYQPALEKVKKYYTFCLNNLLSLVDCLNDAKTSELASAYKSDYVLNHGANLTFFARSANAVATGGHYLGSTMKYCNIL